MDGQLNIIQAFTNSLSANTSLEKVCCELVSKTIEFFGAVDVAVYLYTDKTQELVRTASAKSGTGTLHVPHPPKILLPGDGFAGCVFKKGKADLRTRILRSNSPRKTDYCEMAVPLCYANKAIGVIHVISKRRGKITED